MPGDVFQSYGALSHTLVRGTDYDFVVKSHESSVAIIAPHGGLIEPGTSEIAAAIAGQRYNLYCFEGLKKRPHHQIHLTSHKFDEPCCVGLVSLCDHVVAVHGRRDVGDGKTIFLGGLDRELRDAISRRLKDAGFVTQVTGDKFLAVHPMNICNRGRRKQGAQLELPLALRTKLSDEKSLLDDFSNAVRDAIGDRADSP